jgi:hypothetical protein
MKEEDYSRLPLDHGPTHTALRYLLVPSDYYARREAINRCNDVILYRYYELSIDIQVWEKGQEGGALLLVLLPPRCLNRRASRSAENENIFAFHTDC